MKKYYYLIIALAMMFIGVQNTFAIEELVFNEEGRFIVPFEDLVADGDFTFAAQRADSTSSFRKEASTCRKWLVSK